MVVACAQGPDSTGEPGAWPLEGRLETIVVEGPQGATKHFLVPDDGSAAVELDFDVAPTAGSGARIGVRGRHEGARFRVSAFDDALTPAGATETRLGALSAAPPEKMRTIAFVMVDYGEGVNVTAAAAQRFMFSTTQPGPTLGIGANDKSTLQFYDETSFGFFGVSGGVEGPLQWTGAAACNGSGGSQLATMLRPMVPTAYGHYIWYYGSVQSACEYGWGSLGNWNNAVQQRLVQRRPVRRRHHARDRTQPRLPARVVDQVQRYAARQRSADLHDHRIRQRHLHHGEHLERPHDGAGEVVRGVVQGLQRRARSFERNVQPPPDRNGVRRRRPGAADPDAGHDAAVRSAADDHRPDPLLLPRVPERHRPRHRHDPGGVRGGVRRHRGAEPGLRAQRAAGHEPVDERAQRHDGGSVVHGSSGRGDVFGHEPERGERGRQRHAERGGHAEHVHGRIGAGGLRTCDLWRRHRAAPVARRGRAARRERAAARADAAARRERAAARADAAARREQAAARADAAARREQVAARADAAARRERAARSERAARRERVAAARRARRGARPDAAEPAARRAVPAGTAGTGVISTGGTTGAGGATGTGGAGGLAGIPGGGGGATGGNGPGQTEGGCACELGASSRSHVPGLAIAFGLLGVVFGRRRRRPRHARPS